MKKRHSKAEIIKKRNSDLEINKRLHRMRVLSLSMSCALIGNPSTGKRISMCMGELFSYLHDDALYVWNELNKRKLGGKRLVRESERNCR
ncbi:TPA: hypothetical protein RPE44_002175 [Salmonella enterica]|nr:hypothetical protein [Salmonella enterica]EEE3049526.1 hypothetical protein [Salmonella enterica subsp. enterica serovar Duisburg]EHT5515202.1 hypothetical protein [Salmonella enterica subsp. enterica serovar Sandiego]EBQ0835827.1 hypothetical protein [Salmonella enterica]EBR1020828.1 hypothetical protein [Salmonella enterica]